MKKLLLILLIALVTCAAIEEETFDEDVVLEGWFKKFKPKNIIKKVNPGNIIKKVNPGKVIKKVNPGKVIKKVNPGKVIKKVNPGKIIKKVNPGNIIKKVNPGKIIKKFDPKKLFEKIDPKKILKNIPALKKLRIKIDGLFKGKVGNAFRRLGDVVKKGIAWLKQNKLWGPIVSQLKELGGRYGNELCMKILPAEVCGPAINFAFNHVLGSEEEEVEEVEE
jgi:hypothetical protein